MESDAGSPVLASLQSQRELSVRSDPGPAPHETYWTQLTALTRLSLDSCVPAGISGLANLRVLNIFKAEMADLPAGPYLRRLEGLSMMNCAFEAGVPASLAAATQLRKLEFDESNGGIELAPADVAVLSSLPALKALRLAKPEAVDGHVWGERLAQLRAACAAQGREAPL